MPPSFLPSFAARCTEQRQSGENERTRTMERRFSDKTSICMRRPAANSILVSSTYLDYRSGGRRRVIYHLCGIDHASQISTRQILMPYPIFRDGMRGDELLILGTKKARDLVEESRKRRNESERGEIKPANLERGEAARRGEDGGRRYVRRRWTPRQIRRGS